MSRLFDILSFLSLLALALPLGTQAQSSSYNPVIRWRYLGCYNKTIYYPGFGERALYDGVRESLSIMTVRMCITFCDSDDYVYAGVEYGQECYCSYHMSNVSAQLNQSDCDLPCAGNSSETCGGHLKLGVFRRNVANAAAGLKLPSLVDGTRGSVGSLLALGVAVVALLYLTW
ncbi:hypothetical protein OIDMADRAFT_156821 [Oidiodendron maius Zn]|uniref:WSC domain-containing protein n=1 Tax=Oidiodendron maius (strain Zn) TaxID=913774 RepID=A0A0C3DRJ0_OIDMZ|nr:hypothetical protein OIDMADRAFT_156821 [Oidiodendron maius Zn]